MPGIVGIISKGPGDRARAELARMLESMRHESFYRSGTWVDEDLGLYAGWMEREEAYSSPMPQRGESGEKVLLFSGDEFAEPGAVRGLRERGHDVCEGSRCRLVHVAEEDASFPAGLNGQFQGLLADRRNGTVTLFNDRYGLRRVYYYESNDAFYFAAEAKALLAVRPELRELDPRGMGELIACGCVLEDRTLFKSVFVLPWASSWVFRGGTLETKGQYFSRREWESQPVMGAAEYYREVRETFGNHLPRFFSSAERTGLSLTGGLDTRAILAWKKPELESLPCYTFGGSYQESRDVRIARRVAEMCDQTHQVIGVGDDFLARFPRYAERSVYLTDGCAGVQHAADLYVNQAARKIAPIRMTGNYGDQVLLRKTVFRPVQTNAELLSPEFLPHVWASRKTYSRCMQGHALTVATTRQTSWFFHSLLALELSQVSMRTPYIDNDLIGTLYRAPGPMHHVNDLRVRLIADGCPKLGKLRTDLGFAGGGGRVVKEASRILHRFTMRAEYAFEFGDPRWLTRLDRSLLGRRLERQFMGIHKFAHYSRWYRESLAPYVRELLLDSRTLSRPYLQRAAVERIVKEHVSGAANHTAAIHHLLSLEYIHRIFIDTP